MTSQPDHIRLQIKIRFRYGHVLISMTQLIDVKWLLIFELTPDDRHVPFERNPSVQMFLSPIAGLSPLPY